VPGSRSYFYGGIGDGDEPIPATAGFGNVTISRECFDRAAAFAKAAGFQIFLLANTLMGTDIYGPTSPSETSVPPARGPAPAPGTPAAPAVAPGRAPGAPARVAPPDPERSSTAPRIAWNGTNFRLLLEHAKRAGFPIAAVDISGGQ